MHIINDIQLIILVNSYDSIYLSLPSCKRTWKCFLRVGQETSNSNALANISQHLIRNIRTLQHVYSVIYCWTPDVMSNTACDWSV